MQQSLTECAVTHSHSLRAGRQTLRFHVFHFPNPISNFHFHFQFFENFQRLDSGFWILDFGFWILDDWGNLKC